MPSPRPRFRVIGKKGGAQFVNTYMPPEYVAWKSDVTDYVRGVNDRPPEALYSLPTKVSMVARVAPPKTTSLTHPKPDVDNYAKGIMDAMTEAKVWWDDDKRVVHLTSEKRWCLPSETPGFEVTVTYLP